jgi:hypothetical protein
MAKDVLDKEYESKCNAAKSLADINKEAYIHPVIYTLDEITAKATELNNFINQKY